MQRLNWLTILIALYVGAIIMYAFKDSQEPFWALYHNWVTTYMAIVLILGALKKNKSNLDKSLLISIGLVKLFTAVAFNVWYCSGYKDHPYNNDPNIFCIIVVVTFGVAIFVTYLKSKADERGSVIK